MFLFVKQKLKKCSLLACEIFYHPLVKNFSLPKNEESTPFFVNFIGIIVVLGQKS